MRNEMNIRTDSAKRLETEIHSLKYMLDTQALNESRAWATDAKVKYDYTRISNPRDHERLFVLQEQADNLQKTNKEKTAQINMYKGRIDSYAKIIQANAMTICDQESE